MSRSMLSGTIDGERDMTQLLPELGRFGAHYATVDFAFNRQQLLQRSGQSQINRRGQWQINQLLQIPRHRVKSLPTRLGKLTYKRPTILLELLRRPRS